MRGITIIELLVVIAIIAILMGAALGPGYNLILKSRVNESVNKLVADIEETRRRSVTENYVYGIFVGSDNRSYIIFRDANRNCSYDNGEEIETIRLAGGVTFSGQNTLVWDRKGAPRNSSCGFGAVTFELSGGSYSKRVVVSRLGRINIE